MQEEQQARCRNRWPGRLHSLASQHVRAQRCRLERLMLGVFGGLLEFDSELIRARPDDGALAEAHTPPRHEAMDHHDACEAWSKSARITY